MKKIDCRPVFLAPFIVILRAEAVHCRWQEHRRFSEISWWRQHIGLCLLTTNAHLPKTVGETHTHTHTHTYMHLHSCKDTHSHSHTVVIFYDVNWSYHFLPPIIFWRSVLINMAYPTVHRAVTSLQNKLSHSTTDTRHLLFVASPPSQVYCTRGSFMVGYRMGNTLVMKVVGWRWWGWCI